MYIMDGIETCEQVSRAHVDKVCDQIADAILDAHLQAYGQDNAERAYRETNTALTYMLAIGCARSTDLDGSLDFVQRCFRAAMNKLTAGGQ